MRSQLEIFIFDRVKRNLNFCFSYSMCTMTSLNVFGKMVYSGLLCRCSNISVCIFDLLLLFLEMEYFSGAAEQS